jgi:hypothetical protein
MVVWKRPFSKIPSLAVLRDKVLRIARSAQRADQQRCSNCGGRRFPGDGKLCDYCRQLKSRATMKWRKAHPEIARQMLIDFRNKNRADVNAKARAYRDEQILEGTCSKCTEPALEDSEFCDKHREQSRAKARRYQARKRAKLRGASSTAVPGSR